jgi:anthranilate synthase/aminodeoxychorismate synthase-like glutamine amidotransferase
MTRSSTTSSSTSVNWAQKQQFTETTKSPSNMQLVSNPTESSFPPVPAHQKTKITSASTLGVCLGHQGIIHAYGGRITHAKKLMHGKTCTIKHDQKAIFKGVRNPFTATRYHSLAGERGSIPDCLEITAEAVDDGEIMGIQHVKYPIFGVQFHPESILCEDGKLIVKNFLEGKQ